MARRDRPRHRLQAAINVLPFVDVMLVLLVIFLAAVPALVQGLSVDLPFTRTAEAVHEDAGHIVVTIKKDGTLYVEDFKALLPDMEKHVRVLAVERGKRVYVRADKEVPHGQVVEVMDAVKRAGAPAVYLVTEPYPEDAPGQGQPQPGPSAP
ncbi:MAG: ExbD/TolR family protein [Thermodesulfobacteriota bacterium]